MKTVFNYLFTFILFVFSCHSLFSQCTNGGLELNNLTSWNTWYGAFNTAPENMTIGVIQTPSPSVLIRDIGNDESVNNNLQRVFEGLYSLRIGNLHANTAANINSSMASYTFTVDASNENFRFWYAMVANSSPHASDDELNRMTWYMKLGPGTTANAAIPVNTSDPSWNLYQLTAFQRVIPQDPATDPWFTQFNNSPIWYRGWTCQNYDLSAWRGQQITIYFRTYDCLPGGDLLYMYVDGLCSADNLNVDFSLPATACRTPENPLILDATATQNADSYTLSIVEDLPPGTPLQTIFSTLYTGTFFTQPPGIVDIRELYRTQTGITRFQCGKRYKVRLTATNSCGENGYVEKIIRITCPPVNAGSDKVVCCGQNVTIGLNLGGYIWPYPSFSWSPVPAGVAGNTAQMTFTPTQSGIYTLTTTDNNGCTNSDRVSVKVKNDFNVTITENCPTNNLYSSWTQACNQFYTADIKEISCNEFAITDFNINDYTFTWEINGITYNGKTVPKQPYNPIFGSAIKLFVTNGCFSKTVIFEQTCKFFTGNFPAVIMPNSVNPNSSVYENSVLRIQQFGNLPNWYIGAPAAYNAWGYRLKVYHRWGPENNLVYDSDLVIDYTGIEQGQILWDPPSNLQLGQYVYTLDLYNCTYPAGKRVTWAVGEYCADEGHNGQYHTAAWPSNCWVYPVCCSNPVIGSNTPTNNISGIYTVWILQ